MDLDAIIDTHRVLWGSVLAAVPSAEGIPIYLASNDSTQLKLRVPDGSALPQLLMKVLLTAGQTSAACALVRMCNRKTRIEPLFLLLEAAKGKKIEEFLPEKNDRETLRRALPGTAKYLFKQGLRERFFKMVALCPQQFKAMVLVRTLSPPFIGPISLEARAELTRRLRDAMKFAVHQATKDPDPSGSLQELGMLVDALYDARSKLPSAEEMAIELSFVLGDVEHKEARLQLEAIGITAEVGEGWTWPGDHWKRAGKKSCSPTSEQQYPWVRPTPIWRPV